jgi:endonuclease/exonuclease/phosphatase family metal-dependent hydrolase
MIARVRPVRVVTLNLWNDRSEVEARMRVAAAGIKALAPDIIALQEVAVGEKIGNQAEILAAAIDGHVAFDPVEERRVGESMMGNAIVSRFPIKKMDSISLPSAPDDPRRAMYCALDTPTGVLPFFNCHLSWEMWHSPRREAQVVALDQFARARPADCPAIICGDFNTSPDSAAILFMTGRMGLSGRGTYYRDAWARRHPHDDGYTWSDKNPHTVRWIERNRRLDYIFVGQIREDGWGAILDSRVVLDMPGADGSHASDHFGVYAEIGIDRPEIAV